MNVNFAIESGYSKPERKLCANLQILLPFDALVCFFNFPHAINFKLHSAVHKAHAIKKFHFNNLVCALQKAIAYIDGRVLEKGWNNPVLIEEL